MARRKVIALRDGEQRERLLVAAVGPVLAEVGYAGLDMDAVCRHARVPRHVAYAGFQGLEGLVAAWAETGDHWPSLEEMIGPEGAWLRGLDLGGKLALMYSNYIAALRRRPRTLDILARESVERTALTHIVEETRVRRSLELFEHVTDEFPEDIDMSALVALMAAAVVALAVKSRRCKSYGGVDLQTDQGWQRFQRTLEALLGRVMGGP